MPTPDADIPQALQGELTLLVADAGGSRVLLHHRLEDEGIDDPAFRALTVQLRIAGLSERAVERISAILRSKNPRSRLPARADILGMLP